MQNTTKTLPLLHASVSHTCMPTLTDATRTRPQEPLKLNIAQPAEPRSTPLQKVLRHRRLNGPIVRAYKVLVADSSLPIQEDLEHFVLWRWKETGRLLKEESPH